MTPAGDAPQNEDGRAAAARVDVGSLRDLLAAIRGQTRRWIWVESLALVCIALVGFFWASLAVDWWLEPPREARAAVLVALAAGLAVLVAKKLCARLSAGLSDSSLAVVVERAHPGFRDSLSTAIELAEAPPEDVDAGLLSRTAAEALAMVGQVRPERIFRRRELAMLAFVAGLAVASVLALVLAKPAVAGLWVRRLPLLGDDAWPRRVHLSVEGFPGGVRKVARGADVDVIVHALAEGEPPEQVDLRWRAKAEAGSGRTGGVRRLWHTDRMGGRGGLTAAGQAFGHVLKGVGETLELEIRGGDARLRGLTLEVLEPPALEQLRITATLPAYLGGGVRVLPPARIVQVPRGAAVEIACTASKPLSAATMAATALGAAAAGAGPGGGFAGGAAAAAGVPSAGGMAETVLATLPETADGSAGGISGQRGITGRIDPLDADRTIVVRFTDSDGLTNREPVTFVLQAVPDEPPRVAVALRGISTAVTARARVPVVGTLSDDHGLAAATVVVKAADGAEKELPVTRVRPGETVVELPQTAPEIVALESLGLAVGTKLELRLAATDGCTLAGGPNRGASDTWSLDVVSPEALVAMLEAREIILRRRYESVVADFAQARDRLAPAAAGEAAEGERADERAGAAAGLGEATSRATGETGELSTAFRAIRLEFENNQLLSPELETRLVTQIADPLGVLATKDLPALAAACRGGRDRAELLRRADEVLARMRAILDKMMELESFNEVVELLRGMIRTQDQIRTETLEQQKRRAREALERP